MANEFTRKRVAKLTYDFTKDPTVGTIGAVITKVLSVGATLTSANGNNATIAITGGGVTILGAGTITEQVIGGTAVTDLLRAKAIVTGLGYTPILATASAPLAITSGVSALTGGGFT